MSLPLDRETPREWVRLVEREPLALLSDHAHCELKAASVAHALVAKNPGHARLSEELGEVAVEEAEHFVVVVRALHARGGALGPQDENPYAAGLHARSASTRTSLLLDRLLVAHLIEARSLERFHLLAHHLRDDGLRSLYAELLPSEARHQGLYTRLARDLFPRATVDARLAALRALEGEVIGGLPFAYRVHSGLAGTRAGAGARG